MIGIVGEIYIRSNRFSNEDVVRQIEKLGGEAWVAPISEWLLYINDDRHGVGEDEPVLEGACSRHI